MLAPPRPLMEMTVICLGSRWQIVVRGELDLRTGRELLDVVTILTSADLIGLDLELASGVDLDLADVTFVDTAGWEAVDAARHRAAANGGTSELIAVSPAVSRFIGLVGATPARTGSAPPNRAEWSRREQSTRAGLRSCRRPSAGRKAEAGFEDPGSGTSRSGR